MRPPLSPLPDLAAAIRHQQNERTLPSVIVDESAGMMTSLTALVLTLLPRRGAAEIGGRAAMAAAPAEGRAAAGAEAEARETADCIVVGGSGEALGLWKFDARG